MGKMVEDYIIMDQVFKAAKDILQGQASDPAARARVQKLGKLVPVLSESIALIRVLLAGCRLMLRTPYHLQDSNFRSIKEYLRSF